MSDVFDSVRQLRREGGAEETSSIARSTRDVVARVRANLMSAIEGEDPTRKNARRFPE